MIYREPNVGEKLYYQPQGRMISYAGNNSYCTVAEMVTFVGYENGNQNRRVFRRIDKSEVILGLEYLFYITGATKIYKRRK